jgi:hypothetical protein
MSQAEDLDILLINAFLLGRVWLGEGESTDGAWRVRARVAAE